VPKNIGIVEGSYCTIDGRAGTWQAEGEFLYCRPTGPLVQPTRADAVPASPPPFMDAAAAQVIRDQAFAEYVERISNEWRS
jgi:hypothetical protein